MFDIKTKWKISLKNKHPLCGLIRYLLGGQLISASLLAEGRFHTEIEESKELTASLSELSLNDKSITPNVCPSSFNSYYLHISDLKSDFLILFFNKKILFD